MFSIFKTVAEMAVSAFRTAKKDQRNEWRRTGELFAAIADDLDSMAKKYEDRQVPREEFVAIQMYAEDLRSMWVNNAMFDREPRKQEHLRWVTLLESIIVTAAGHDGAVFGFSVVPGPFYSQKEGWLEPNRTEIETIPDVHDIRDAAAAFRASSKILKAKGS